MGGTSGTKFGIPIESIGGIGGIGVVHVVVVVYFGNTGGIGEAEGDITGVAVGDP
jgi:hypothetical protein